MSSTSCRCWASSGCYLNRLTHDGGAAQRPSPTRTDAAGQLSRWNQRWTALRSPLVRTVDGEVLELLNEDDLVASTASLPPGTTTLWLVWENRWAGGFADPVRRAGGVLAAHDRISPDRADAGVAARTPGWGTGMSADWAVALVAPAFWAPPRAPRSSPTPRPRSPAESPLHSNRRGRPRKRRNWSRRLERLALSPSDELHAQLTKLGELRQEDLAVPTRSSPHRRPACPPPSSTPSRRRRPPERPLVRRSAA